MEVERTPTHQCAGVSGSTSHPRVRPTRLPDETGRTPGCGQTRRASSAWQGRAAGSPEEARCLRKACVQCPLPEREGAGAPAGVGRAGSNFPTMCKLVNLRVCKRPLKGPNEALH